MNPYTIISLIYSTILGFLLQKQMYNYSSKMNYTYPKFIQLFAAISTGLICSCFWILYGYTLKFLLLSLCCVVLINISFIDSYYLEIPNEHNCIILFIGINYVFMCSLNPIDSILGFLAGGSIYLLFAIASKGGVGGGDIKLAATTGSILGLYNTLFSIYYAILLALIGIINNLYLGIKKKKNNTKIIIEKEIAFGPYITTAVIMILLELA